MVIKRSEETVPSIIAREVTGLDLLPVTCRPSDVAVARSGNPCTRRTLGPPPAANQQTPQWAPSPAARRPDEAVCARLPIIASGRAWQPALRAIMLIFISNARMGGLAIERGHANLVRA